VKFDIDNICGSARAGTIVTKHSTITTPVFMPVGTQATVKALDGIDMTNLGAKIILANTYHLYLRPKSTTIRKAGGIHKFANYPYSFLTDSGGFQAFSLGKLQKNSVKQNEHGIEFRSHIDGSKHIFTPTSVLDTQYDIRSDIMMVLDDLVALPNSKKRIELSVNRTTKWAKQSILYHQQQQKKGIGLDQNIFAIIQGGTDKSLRTKSAKELCSLDGFDGFAIGGLSVGEANDIMYDIVSHTTQYMPSNKPRYLMGVGTPADLISCIDRGVDMFDCVMPTRNARNGTLFTKYGRINIRNSTYIDDFTAIEDDCSCYCCVNFTKAYLNHLYKTKELIYFRLATIHNIHYYLQLMRQARSAIIEDRWQEFKQKFFYDINLRK